VAVTESHIIRRVSVLGVPISVFTIHDIDQVLAALLERKEGSQVIFVSLWDLLRARRNKRYARIVREAALVVPTSRSIRRAARFLDKAEPSAYQPFEFVIRLLGALERRSGSLYILGLNRKAVQVADTNLRQTYPGLRVVGRHPGYFAKERERDIETAIRKANPELLLAGPGVPSGHRWLFQHRQDLGTGVRLWDPDVLDIVVGRRHRPPEGFSGFVDRTSRALIRKPWTILRVLLVPWIGVLLLAHRLLRR
jgi:N-acetylglucosaminyldiphosphoundecaprenol N-acetyl-beta-D-mannosaminyltransferase